MEEHNKPENLSKNIKETSELERLLGYELARIIQFGAFMMLFVVMLIFAIGVPFLMQKMNKPPDEEKFVTQLKQLPTDTQDLITEIVDVQIHTQELLHKLEQDTKESEELLNDKKAALNDVQKQLDVLKLTPEQVRIIETYNKTINKEPASFWEYITLPTTWYERGLSIVLSIVSFLLGLLYQRRKDKK